MIEFDIFQILALDTFLPALILAFNFSDAVARIIWNQVFIYKDTFII